MVRSFTRWWDWHLSRSQRARNFIYKLKYIKWRKIWTLQICHAVEKGIIGGGFSQATLKLSSEEADSSKTVWSHQDWKQETKDWDGTRATADTDIKRRLALGDIYIERANGGKWSPKL